ncbi:MAG: hypothetical protein RLY86_826 [Pseudomonadota bacterium]|jgi:AraC-like DNA-binding protein
MLQRALCEPVELSRGGGLLADRVTHGEGAGPVGHFPHFHDAAELVIFHAVSGTFVAEDAAHTLGPGSIVHVPAMQRHDFDLAPGPKSWVLVQLDPEMVEGVAAQPGLSALRHAFCARPEGETARRIADLAEWLVAVRASGRPDPLATRIVELLLAAVATAPRTAGTPQPGREERFARLRPALERLRRSPAAPLTTEGAAALCHMTPAHFCRRFRSLYGMTFGAYGRAYRLHLAARRLLSGGEGVAAIAYGLGFASPSHFTALFRRRFGVSPTAYRDAARG